MTTNIVKFDSFDVENVVYGSLKVSEYGTRIPVRYQNPKTGQQMPLRLQTPKMLLPFGATQFPKPDEVDDQSKVKYLFNLSFQGDGQDVKSFLKKMEQFQTKLYTDTLKNAQKWVKSKTKSLEVIQEKWFPVLKVGMDKEGNQYPASMSVKLPRYPTSKSDATLEFKTDVYGKGKSKLQLTPETYHDVIPRYSEAKVILNCDGIWVGKTGKISLSFSALQMKVYPSENKISGYAFEDDDTDDETTTTDKVAESKTMLSDDSDDEEVVTTTDTVTTPATQEESEEEESESESEEEAETQAPKRGRQRKKVVNV